MKDNKNSSSDFLASLLDGELLTADQMRELINTLSEIEQETRDKEDAAKRDAERRREIAREERARQREEMRKIEEERAHEAELRQRRIESATAMDLPIDFVNTYKDDVRAAERTDLPLADALLLSLESLGEVDIEFISSVTGRDMRDVIYSLKGSIYQNPKTWGEVFYKGFETAEEYLSGNLGEKLRTAKEANKIYNGFFEENVKVLSELCDNQIDENDIFVTLGSPWVPTEVIDEFIIHLVGKRQKGAAVFREAEYATRHDPITGIWEIPRRNRLHGWARFEQANSSVWGTERMGMLYLMENILNMKTLTIYDTPKIGKSTRVVNRDETVKILEKQDKMIAEFKKWVWQDDARAEKLRTAYTEKYGNIRRRRFDGSFLEFPGMSEDIKLYPYQKNSVARIIMSPNTLLAHNVGSGKTYVMIAAGMELRRLGKSKKNLYVLPNNIIMQWEILFKKMYPEAKLFVVTNKNYTQKKRNETLAYIQNGDYDAILMAYSCFDALPLSKKYQKEHLEERQMKLQEASDHFVSDGKLSARLRSTLEAIRKIESGNDDGDDIEICFDDLGINTLFVDEAHNYKNVELESSITRISGAGNGGSKKAISMMDKVHCVQRNNNGGRVIFATGTPVTNSITDIFVMQKYLQEGELEFLGLHNFDSWVGMFAEKVTDFEIDVDTASYHLVTRFARFANIPELSGILASIADFHVADADEMTDIPKFRGYSDSAEEGSDIFKEYLEDISERADKVRGGEVSRTEDNLLKITSDGRRAALDMRLIDCGIGLEPGAKVERCAENVTRIYNATRDTLGAQLVFCDISTPKEGFNLYDELRDICAGMGVPREKIAFVHDASNDTAREKLFEKMRTGEISVLVGSTFKLGIGVNVQERLVALHHLDVPWRPADMVQREGRILRAGNTNPEVEIYRYITKGSFDAYSWQLLETKQRFISQILTGNSPMRTGEDVDETVLNYAEVKALAVGNPLIKRRVEILNELSKYRILKLDVIAQREREERELECIPNKRAELLERIEKCQADIANLEGKLPESEGWSIDEKKNFRVKVFNDIWGHTFCEDQYFISKYSGFDLIVPPRMAPHYRGKDDTQDEVEGEEIRTGRQVPYMFIVGEGRYTVEIESEIGIIRRLDNFLFDQKIKRRENGEEETVPSGIKKALLGHRKALADLAEREASLRETLQSGTDFDEVMDKLRRELERINKKLGVSN